MKEAQKTKQQLIELIGELRSRIAELQRTPKRRSVKEAGPDLWRHVFEHAGWGVAILDGDGKRIKVMNPAFADMHGVPAAELAGKPLSAVFAPECRGDLPRHMRIAGGRGRHSFESLHLRRERTPFPVLIDAAVVKDGAGKALHWIVSVQDLSARKLVEEMLRKEKNVAQRYLDIIGSILIVINADETVGLINRRGLELLGYRKKDVIGKNWFDLFIPERLREEVRVAFTKLMTGDIEPVEYFENPILTKRNGERLIAWHNTVLTDDRGTITGTLSSGEDVTSRRQAEERLSHTLRELTRSNAELEQFAHIASHDLKEPLITIGTNLKLLERRLRGGLEEESRQFIARAIEETVHMQALISDLLAYSRVDAQKKPLKPTDCAAVLNRAKDRLSTAIEQSRAVVKSGPLPVVMADPTLLSQVFQNLIENALKFRGEKEPRIDIAAKQLEGEWVFSVRDNGIGIPPGKYEHLFKLFHRAHREQYPGTGIGLATCKKIIERHGGRIWAESVEGRGTTFYFTIPLRDREWERACLGR